MKTRNGTMENKGGQGMDVIDQKQQEEIEALKRKDVSHDSDFKWFKFVLFVFTVWVALSSAIVFVLLDKLDKTYDILLEDIKAVNAQR